MGSPVDGGEDLGISAWAAVLRCHAAVVPVINEEVLRATGLALSWYDVLLEVRGAPDGRLRMQQLADRVVLSRSRVSRIVEEMASAGLLERGVNPLDRRSALISMTPAGERAFRAAAPVYLEAIRRNFAAHLSEGEQEVVARALRRTAAAAGAGD